jgi:VWFA-related protein
MPSGFSRRSLLSLLLGIPVLAQEDVPTFTAEVKMVGVLASVRDKKGHLVSDLNQPDFTILEDGRPQVMRYFNRQADLPLVIGLLIDTSLSQDRVIDPERAACFRFLDQVLRENKDKIFILQFDMDILVREPMTSSWKDLNKSLESVNTPSHRELENRSGPGTLLYDALVQGAKMMQPQRGRKALIVMTDGVDTGSDADLTAAMDAAVRADTLIYSILFSDSGYYGLFGDGGGRRVLEKLSKDSGGGFFEVSKKLSIQQIFDIIQDELRTQYAMAYVSDRPVDVAEFRKIEVKIDRRDLVVQARDRYWAQR